MKVYVILLATLLAINFVMAAQPMQQSNKIYLDPFYRQSMLLGTNYTYLIKVNPPDGISSVVSAIISFDIYMTPSVNFSLSVNGQKCNTPWFYVSTTFASAGQARVNFDCNNIINKSGTYTVVLRTTQANTGSVSGWLDLTYMNNPRGTVELSGTEYYENDDGTVFLQLMDSAGVAINNATCSLNIYYPNTVNTTHPIFITNGMMLFLNNGIYYYDFTIPNLAGVYIVDAKCTYLMIGEQYYPAYSALVPVRNVSVGVYTGDPIVLNDYSDWLYTQCDSSGGSPKVCDAFYEWDIHVNDNYTLIYINYLGENTVAATINFSVWNWSSSSWITLPNALTFKATASGVPSGVDEYVSNQIPDLNNTAKVINGTRKVRVRSYVSAGSTFKLFSNWLALIASSITGNVQELKGSGEVHVSSVVPNAESSRFFKITTCGGYKDGRCGEFTDDDEFDFTEGEIEEYINVSATSTKSDIDLQYYSPFGVDCTALYWIKKWNGTTWNEFSDYSVYSRPADENCLITLRFDITAGQQYDFWIKMDNFMKWEVDYSIAALNKVTESIDKYCLNRNFTYINPITEASIMPNDTTTKFCYEFYDDVYWYSLYYNDSQSVTVAGEYASYLQEIRFYNRDLYNKYLLLVDVFANISTSGIQKHFDDLLNATKIDNDITRIQIQNTNLTVVTRLDEMNVTLAAHTSLLQQIWTWVQSIFGWVQTDVDQNASTSIVTKDISGTVNFIDAQYYVDTQGTVLVQVLKDGFSVDNAVCAISIYYPNMTKMINNSAMAFMADGVYTYGWIPMQIGANPAKVNCTGGDLINQVQSSGTLQVLPIQEIDDQISVIS